MNPMRLSAVLLLCAMAIGRLAAAEPAAVPLLAHYIPDYPKFAPLPAGLPFTKAVKATITAAVDHPWQERVFVKLPAAVRKGDLLAVDLWARALSPGAQLHIAIQERRAPYTQSAKRLCSPCDAWEHLVVAGKALADYAAGDLALQISLGYGKQSLALSEVGVGNYGQTPLTPEQLTERLMAVGAK